MTILYLAGRRVQGLSTDTKPISTQAGTIFDEIDTNKSYLAHKWATWNTSNESDCVIDSTAGTIITEAGINGEGYATSTNTIKAGQSITYTDFRNTPKYDPYGGLALKASATQSGTAGGERANYEYYFDLRSNLMSFNHNNVNQASSKAGSITPDNNDVYKIDIATNGTVSWWKNGVKYYTYSQAASTSTDYYIAFQGYSDNGTTYGNTGVKIAWEQIT